MKIIISSISILVFVLLLNINLIACPQDSIATVSKDNLCKTWNLKELTENGKSQDLYEYQIVFNADGTYSETEEGDIEKGIWELNDNSTSIIFDKNTPDQDEWVIVNFDNEKLIVKFTDEDKNFQFTLIPVK